MNVESHPTKPALDRLTKFTAAPLDHSRDPSEGNPQSISLRTCNAIIVLCLVYLWLRPVSDNSVLIPVLFVMGLASAAVCVIAARRFAPGFGPIWVSQVVFALLGTAIGAITAAPGILYGVLIYAAAPILYWTWVRALDLGAIRLALVWLAISTSALSTVIILFVAGETGLMPQVVPAALLDASGAAFSAAANTSTQIRFYGLSTLAAAGPLWAASLFVRADKLMPPAAIRVYAASSSIVAALVAGRRAIVVAIVLAPVVAWMCIAVIRWQEGSGRRLGRVGLALGATLLIFGVGSAVAPSLVSFSAISDSFASAQALVFGGGAGVVLEQDIRVAEGKALIDGWLTSPLVGNGFGATLSTFWRDPVRPWNFELQYHTILFQTGLAGVLIGILALLSTLRQLRAAARAMPDYTATLVVTTTGAVSLLFANSVDPYLLAPGHMWAIYLPLAVSNVMLMAHMNPDQDNADQDNARPTGDAELQVPRARRRHSTVRMDGRSPLGT